MSALSELVGNTKRKRDYLSVVEKEIGDLMNECYTGLRDLKSRDWDRILFWLKSTKETGIHTKPISVCIQQKTVQTY
jgi:predicted thioredoxin/glutaredoxin